MAINPSARFAPCNLKDQGIRHEQSALPMLSLVTPIRAKLARRSKRSTGLTQRLQEEYSANAWIGNEASARAAVPMSAYVDRSEELASYCYARFIADRASVAVLESDETGR